MTKQEQRLGVSAVTWVVCGVKLKKIRILSETEMSDVK